MIGGEKSLEEFIFICWGWEVKDFEIACIFVVVVFEEDDLKVILCRMGGVRLRVKRGWEDL